MCYEHTVHTRPLGRSGTPLALTETLVLHINVHSTPRVFCGSMLGRETSMQAAARHWLSPRSGLSFVSPHSVCPLSSSASLWLPTPSDSLTPPETFLAKAPREVRCDSCGSAAIWLQSIFVKLTSFFGIVTKTNGCSWCL